MTDFIIKKLPYDLTSNAGLALVGQYFKRLGINQRIDPRFPISGKGIANSDVLKSYLGLLVQGKNDFDAIEAFRADNPQTKPHFDTNHYLTVVWDPADPAAAAEQLKTVIRVRDAGTCDDYQ